VAAAVPRGGCIFAAARDRGRHLILTMRHRAYASSCLAAHAAVSSRRSYRRCGSAVQGVFAMWSFSIWITSLWPQYCAQKSAL
jgi:hypothetical protein